MRYLAILAAVIASPGASSQSPKASPPKTSLKPFEFRGFVAGEDMTAEQLSTCQKVVRATFCGPDSNIVAGVKVQQVYVSAEGMRMVSVGILSDPIFFGALTDAFKAKYGKPCATSVPLWVGEMGNKRPNPTITWCFKTGKLVARMYGALLTSSEINYVDSSQSPPVTPKPKIDF